MLQIFRAMYIILIGYLILRMFRGGGCCGGHGHNHGNSRRRDDYDINKSKRLIDDEEKIAQ
ncbi:hypothetical protein [Wukongibacter sp. M2B1]|uniref:hypothetical protein n=1 Tax=Wukongibacter sp. M2B1 TaxID=3088895 RepID=UPI003D7943DC